MNAAEEELQQAPTLETLEDAMARQREKLIAGEDYGLEGDELTELLLGYSLCPIHRWDYAICFDDLDVECEQVRAIHPGHDT